MTHNCNETETKMFIVVRLVLLTNCFVINWLENSLLPKLLPSFPGLSSYLRLLKSQQCQCEEDFTNISLNWIFVSAPLRKFSCENSHHIWRLVWLPHPILHPKLELWLRKLDCLIYFGLPNFWKFISSAHISAILQVSKMWWQQFKVCWYFRARVWVVWSYPASRCLSVLIPSVSLPIITWEHANIEFFPCISGWIRPLNYVTENLIEKIKILLEYFHYISQLITTLNMYLPIEYIHYTFKKMWKYQRF